MVLEAEINKKNGIFKALVNDIPIGEISFVWIDENVMAFNHTEIYTEFSGRGLGKQMVLKALEYARNNHLKILPLCSFVSYVFEQNQENQDLLK